MFAQRQSTAIAFTIFLICLRVSYNFCNYVCDWKLYRQFLGQIQIEYDYKMEYHVKQNRYRSQRIRAAMQA